MTRAWRSATAVGVGVIVVLLTLWGRIPVGAGTYYDDGVYLGLGRALAEGHGYVYSNLPGAIPGVKYPPLYPVALAAGWKAFPNYPNNLGPLKALNAAFIGAAAALTFLLFARGSRRRTLVTASVTLFGFLAVPMLSMTTVLLSEPLFLMLGAAALLASARLARVERWAGGSAYVLAMAAGLLAAATFLTRSIGLAMVLAVLGAAAMRVKPRLVLVLAIASITPVAAWMLWSHVHAGEVPAAIVGQYGTYFDWLRTDKLGILGRLGRNAAAHGPPLLETLQFVWIPRTPAVASYVMIGLAAAALLAGLVATWKRNPALVLFFGAYLLILLAWPYEPYRFYYALLPLTHLLVAEGVLVALPHFRRDFPAWGLPIAGLAGAVLVLNSATYQLKGYSNRAWTSPQTIPAAAYDPLAEWIRSRLPPDAIIASGLDPYLHWETGRRTVPSWVFAPTDYGAYERRPQDLADGVDSILETFGASHIALIEGDYKAAHALEAYLELHPDRLEKVFESAGTQHTGVVYRLLAAETANPPNPQ